MAVKSRTIFTGDNLAVMRGMEDNSIDMIYLDPPFNSNHNYAASIGSKANKCRVQRHLPSSYKITEP